MATSQITVQSDPRFSGSISEISAEDWLLQLQNSAVSQGKTGKEAIAYYRAHLLGPARSRLGQEGSDFRRVDWERADVDEELWASTFRQAYFKATTQAESVTDWAKIRQLPKEKAGDLVARVGDAIKAFWTAVNGERPKKTAAIGSAATHRPSDAANQAINEATHAAIKRLERIALVRAESDSLRSALAQLKHRIQHNADNAVVKFTDAEKLQLYEALDVTVEEDRRSDADMRIEMEKVFKEEINPVHMQQHYDDFLEATRRALMLRTLHTAFANPKCREEAFTYLKHPERDLTDFNISIKQAESAAEAKPTQHGRQGYHGNRNRVNAVHTEDAEDDADETAQNNSYPDPSQDPAFAEHVAAFYNKKKGKPGSTAQNKGNGSSQDTTSNRDKNKICDHCGFRGHVVKNCNLKKAAAARKKAANVAASQQPAEN